MLSSSEIIKVVYDTLRSVKGKNVVIDPMMVSKSGYYLLTEEAIEALKDFLKIGILVIPNIPEAEILASMKIESEEDMILAAKKIKNLGVENVLIKGGHREENCTDILLTEKGEIIKFYEEKFETKNTYGTGCTLSSTIASYIGKGYSVSESIEKSKKIYNGYNKKLFLHR